MRSASARRSGPSSMSLCLMSSSVWMGVLARSRMAMATRATRSRISFSERALCSSSCIAKPRCLKVSSTSAKTP